jgi:hypothetical protein
MTGDGTKMSERVHEKNTLKQVENLTPRQIFDKLLENTDKLRCLSQEEKNRMFWLFTQVNKEWILQKQYAETWCGHVRDYKKLLLRDLEK